MVEPKVIPRDAHTVSRRDIDSDALKVLYRLREGGHVAYLVGGSVRDLLLARRPKDFDIGTSAHPSQVKKLFRNCWIIGRRFRLAHVRFGTKVVEVATFRRQVQPGEEIVQDGVPATAPAAADVTNESTAEDGRAERAPAVHHDNTFGTPEEDAFRRDFTINALFYDISTFAIIDYVNGLDDLRAGIVRCIGDPEVRMIEDPVRMLRAIALAARLDFVIDPPLASAIDKLRHEIARSAPPRMLEEYYKILRAGSGEKTFRGLAAAGLLEPISEELHHGSGDALWSSLAALDTYRRRFSGTPDTLTNPVLLGSLLVPIGLAPQQGRTPLPESSTGKRRRRPIGLKLGPLPIARRDVERLRQLLGLQRRLHDLTASVRNQRALTHRSIFREALTWLEIHGNAPDLVEHWVTVLAERGAEEPVMAPAAEGGADTGRPRKRRRRRRKYHRPAQ
ncbi:MAG: polynucleotide adenylyltransferase PcnB [Acidobacteriaceae bacterium]|jgi:poly(A) polymerase|nr:polynucleotide adenylyltransferase PcnB [Acidobacteriaceae bacterium]